MVRNEPDQAEACHCCLKFDICDLLVQVLRLRLTNHLLSGRLQVRLNEFTIGELFTPLRHLRELPVAVIYQLDQGIICGLTSRSMK